MANLATRRSDRGQLLILSAFALGVLFVALALILNSAIFTENLASRGETTGGNNVVKFQDDLDRGVGVVLAHENRFIDNHPDIEDRINTSVSELDDALTDSNVVVGSGSRVSVRRLTRGALINQTDISRDFVDASGTADWAVVEDVNQTRSFTMTVTQSDVSETCTILSDCFVLDISNGTTSWQLSMGRDAATDEVTVQVDNGTIGSCTADSTTFDVNITDGTVAGKNCQALSVADGPNTSYDIDIRNGDQAGGTYSLVVDNTTVATSPPAHFSSSGDPSVTPALYDVVVDYEYQAARVEYDSTLQIAPGEPDE